MTAAGIPALLEPIQARLDAATPGPWESKGIANGRSDLFANGDYYGGKKSVATAADSEFGACSDNDAEFIAAAPTDTARLLAAVKAVATLHVREVIAVYPGYGEEAWCPVCQEHWPCPTVSAVEAALGEL